MTSKIKHQGNDVTSSISRVFAHNNSTNKSRRSITIGRKVVHAAGDIEHQFKVKGSKVKVTGRIKVLALQNTTCFMARGHIVAAYSTACSLNLQICPHTVYKIKLINLFWKHSEVDAPVFC